MEEKYRQRTGTQLSPLQTFLAMAPSSGTAPARIRPSALTTASAATTGAREQQEAWERNLMATTSLRGKIGELFEEWHNASRTLQSLAKDVHELSARQSSSGEPSGQETASGSGNSTLVTNMDKSFSDLRKQADEHEFKISERIREQTSHISQEIIVLQEEMGTIHMDLQSIRQSSEKEAIDTKTGRSQAMRTQIAELGELIAAMRQLSQTLDQAVAKNEAHDRLSRQPVQPVHLTDVKEPDATRPIGLEDCKTEKLSIPESSSGEVAESEKNKSATEVWDMMDIALRLNMEQLPRTKETSVNDRARELLAGYQETMTTRLDRLEHKLDLLLSAHTTTGNLTSSLGRLDQRDLIMPITGAFDNPTRSPDTVDLLHSTPDRIPAESAGNVMATASALLSVMSATRSDPAVMSTKSLLSPQHAVDSDESQQRNASATGGLVRSRPQHCEAQEAIASSSSGTKKRMLITFSSSDDEAEQSMIVKRPRPTPDRGTKSLTPPGSVFDVASVPARGSKSSSVTVDRQSGVEARGRATGVPTKGPVVAPRGRRLSVSPELP